LLAELPLLESRQLLAPPQPGEQYRFAFDAQKCIGCKCCVVACNEQNGNPADQQWRRVFALETGVFPLVQLQHISTACQHCGDPSCLKGCPVKAYTKDSATGVVIHDADQCIGCQYCVWNCDYGVPQFNDERGVVGKCDLCHNRLSDGMMPACADACPEQAITIETAAFAPGTLSTTRMEGTDASLKMPIRAHAEPSLVALLLLSQASVGLLAAAVATGTRSFAPAIVCALAMAVAPLHLGRPIHAARAFLGWRTSWLSREIWALSVYFPLALFERGPVALAAGLVAIYCSARIYMVPARPAWNTPKTIARFYATAVVLGLPLFFALSGAPLWIALTAVAFGLEWMARKKFFLEGMAS
jgi:Fe-S-cluster-containing dehydrogenase component